MTMFARSGAKRIRTDATQLADDLAQRMPDFDKTRDQAVSAVHGAADQARHQLDRAAEITRVLRADIAHSADRLAANNPIDEIGQRIRAATSTTAVPALIAQLEKGLPEVDRDAYHRAYTRGRVQARSKYLVVGIVAGVGAGVVAAILLDPQRGKERRTAIAARTSSLTRSLGRQAGAKVNLATAKARGVAAERGIIKPPAKAAAADAAAADLATEGPVTDPASTRWELPTASDGGAIQPLAAAEADFGAAGPTAVQVVADAVDVAGDRSTTRSIHG